VSKKGDRGGKGVRKKKKTRELTKQQRKTCVRTLRGNEGPDFLKDRYGIKAETGKGREHHRRPETGKPKKSSKTIPKQKGEQRKRKSRPSRGNVFLRAHI